MSSHKYNNNNKDDCRLEIGRMTSCLNSQSYKICNKLQVNILFFIIIQILI